ncbi:uncharacterized protein LOC105798547 isoform X2 [Gossypium raimondii]|uniref:uncharacterized protein LOC105798547 isoform X2 n=1 Tax=Gossypium raimondii TaxID=29730 RepID=UPI00227ACBE0|nr:uncharacterized protein LOC105798547 isoform X2 [Gossypium raimondii]
MPCFTLPVFFNQRGPSTLSSSLSKQVFNTHFPFPLFPKSESLTPTALLPFFLNSKINLHLRHQSTSTDPPPVLHGSTHFQNQRLEGSYKRLLPLNFKVMEFSSFSQAKLLSTWCDTCESLESINYPYFSHLLYNAMAAAYKDPSDACAAIAGDSYKRWLELENQTDDITIIIVQIKGLSNSGVGTTDSEVHSRPCQIGGSINQSTAIVPPLMHQRPLESDVG